MNKKKVIWFDITNVPHVNFLLPIIRKYEGEFDSIFSIRDFAETKSLFEQRIHKPYLLIGDHAGGNKLKKVWAAFKRVFALQRAIPYFDIKISVGGDASSIVARMRRKISITFDDNEKAPNWRYAPFATMAFWPKVVPLKSLLKQHFKESRLYRYNGYKEDMYLADYVPDPHFVEQLPFEQYVVVRPENIKANYVEGNSSIVPELLRKLEEKGYNILYLPRYAHDVKYADGIKNIFMPKQALNGLDACYYATTVLTGAGTLAREAACLGIPSVSFFAGKTLLTVDKSLIAQDKMFFSRNVDEIIGYLGRVQSRKADLTHCKEVQNEILSEVDKIVRSV